MDKDQKQLKLIEQRLEAAQAEIKEAMKIADQYGLRFKWEPPAPPVGEGTSMGGWYYGKTHPLRAEETSDYREGWLPSNLSC